MPENERTIFDVSTLNQLSARLIDHADSIVNRATHQLEVDLRLASAVCDRLAELRLQVTGIAGKCRDEDAAKELFEALRNSDG